MNWYCTAECRWLRGPFARAVWQTRVCAPDRPHRLLQSLQQPSSVRERIGKPILRRTAVVNGELGSLASGPNSIGRPRKREDSGPHPLRCVADIGCLRLEVD